MTESKWSRVATESKVNAILYSSVVKSQNRYLASQHIDQGQRSEYSIYQSTIPLYYINSTLLDNNSKSKA